MFDVNAFLGNSVRGDLIGPEMWTAPEFCESEFGPEKHAGTLISAQLPYYAWDAPKPGLSGKLYVAHNTKELIDVVSLELTEISGDKQSAVELALARNEWTPALLKSWYRSRPNALGCDTPELGALSLKESKCISADNVFVAECVLKNTGNTPRCYELTIRGPFAASASHPENSGPFTFVTTAWGDTEYQVFAAVSSTLPGLVHRFELPPYGELKFRYAFAIDAHSAAAALARTRVILGEADAFARNVRRFNDWFAEKVPALRSEDLDILKLYYYRYFVLYRSMHFPRRLLPGHNYPRPAMYESPSGNGYSAVIGLPVPMQVQEAAWLRDPQPGKDHILNWSDGLPEYHNYYIQFTPMSIWRFLQCHPDRELAQGAFSKAREFALRSADQRFDRLPVQTSSWGTGAEYQPNFYQFTDPPWDYRHDCQFAKQGFEIAKLIRLDTAGYAIGNLLGTAKIAGFLGDGEAAARLAGGAAEMLEIVKTKHWDDRLQLFLAADPGSGRLADQAACYDSFVPYMWGMIQDKKYLEAFNKFTDPAWFWDDFPLCTAAKTCPMYFGGAALVGPAFASPAKPHYYNCSWNGPTWHYSNSLAAEAFGQAALAAPEWRTKWMEYFRAWTEMHFQYGDRTTPRACEHHRPEDGGRCANTTDYFHSSWIDPFIRYACGVTIADDLKTLSFDPFQTADFELASVPVAGREWTFVQRCEAGVRTLEIRDAQGVSLASGAAPLKLVLP